MQQKIFSSIILLLLTIPILGYSSSDCNKEGCCPTCSHTFLKARPLSQDATLEMDQWHYFMAHIKNEDKPRKKHRIFSLGATFLYQHSTQTSELREYFLKNCNECFLTIAQSPAPLETESGVDPEADINASWLQLNANPDAPFSSRITLSPKRQVIGGIFNIDFSFDQWIKGVSLSAVIPVVHVRHDIGFKETNRVNSGTFPGIANAGDAFNNSAWNYGKISRCSQSKVGVDDIHIKLHWRFIQKSRCGFDIYASIFAPTHKGSKAHYLFEPTVGNGGHVGLGGGLHAGFILSEGNNHTLTLFTNGRYAYFLQGKEKRSFDLCTNKEWSRYLLVAKQEALETPLPGINFFTRECNVTPQSNVELITAFHYNYKHWNFELGHDFWYQQKEKVTLDCNRCDQSTIGIFDLPHVLNASEGPFTTVSTAQINQAYSAVEDQNATFITDSDINVNSGTHPRASSCKLYGSIGYDSDCCTYPWIVALGSSYEWGHRKSTFSQWNISLRTGISF